MNFRKAQQKEILPDYFFGGQAEYAVVSMAEASSHYASWFAYQLNSPLGSKRAGRIISYGIAHGMEVTQMRKITERELEQLTRQCRDDLNVFMPPRHGILRLQTGPTLAEFWRQVHEGMSAQAIHTDMLDIRS